LRKIFDIHMHFPRNWEKPDADPAPLVENLYNRGKEAGLTKANLLCGGRFGITHEASIKLAHRYGDLFLPTAMIDPETTKPAGLRKLRDLGYIGLKMIGVRRDYDCEDYFPVYETAQEFGWPVLLHLGVIGGGIDYSITHPRRDPEAAKTYRRIGPQMGVARNMSAMRMRPFHLDTIANNFPQLKLIGAHLGGTGNYDEAASVARWRHNVYFDISGGTTIERHAVERGLIGREIGCEKLIFGSDTQPDKIKRHIDRWEGIFDLLELREDERERIWWSNGAELYGLQKAAWQRGAKKRPASLAAVPSPGASLGGARPKKGSPAGPPVRIVAPRRKKRRAAPKRTARARVAAARSRR
jgi:predicted TIM-barrel fold metal-dependent hydrolase